VTHIFATLTGRLQGALLLAAVSLSLGGCITKQTVGNNDTVAGTVQVCSQREPDISDSCRPAARLSGGATARLP
jgi:hypothetical protein